MYDPYDQNGVECPFSTSEYIYGSTAVEVSRACPGDHEGIPAQFVDKFWRQVAKAIVQLASIRLPKISSIIRNEDDLSSIPVGPLVDTVRAI